MRVKGNGLCTAGIRSILLIQLGDIGDVVLSLPCMRALRESFPEAFLAVAVREKARDLMMHCTWPHDVVSVHKKKRSFSDGFSYQKRFFKKVRAGRFDLAVDLRTGTRGALLAFLSGARQRVGFYAEDGKVWRNRLFTHLEMPEIVPGRHVAEYYLSVLAAYGIVPGNKIPEYHVSQEKQDHATLFFQEEGIPEIRHVVAVHPFSLWEYKEWGDEKYRQLIQFLVKELHVTVIIVGAGHERERAHYMASCCPEKVFNLAGKTSLSAMAAVLKKCFLFIGGDSAGVHIAAAVGTSTVSIFGPSSAVDWAPRGEKHCVVTKGLDCVPCRDKGCQGSETSRCLEELRFEEVRDRLVPHWEKLSRTMQ